MWWPILTKVTRRIFRNGGFEAELLDAAGTPSPLTHHRKPDVKHALTFRRAEPRA